MGQPNFIPITPDFHKIIKQDCRKEGFFWIVDLEVLDEDPNAIHKLTFEIPVKLCPWPLTVFKLGRYTEGGWGFSYEEEIKVERKEKVEKFLFASGKEYRKA